MEDVIAVIFVFLALWFFGRCDHEWKEESVETTYDTRFDIQYRVHTSKCKQCGKIKVQKFKIN